MSRLGAEKIIAVGAVWLLIMLPSAAFGRGGAEAAVCPADGGIAVTAAL